MTTSTLITSLEAEDLKARLGRDEKLLIIDVRTPAEFESLHIKGAYNIPLALISEHTKEFSSRFPDGVVLVCQSGTRAEEARERLTAAGLDTASVLAGGTAAFAAAGGEALGHGPPGTHGCRIPGPGRLPRLQDPRPTLHLPLRRCGGRSDLLCPQRLLCHGRDPVQDAME